MKLLLILISFFVSGISFCQCSITGRVTIQGSGDILSGSSVYLNNTSLGTVTGYDGKFTISNIPPGAYDLIVTNIGFETFKKRLATGSMPIHLSIALIKSTVELENVLISATTSETWKKWGTVFSKFFLGTSSNAKSCNILNKDALRFRYSKEQNILHVSAKEPLIITNEGLGYEIQYQLNSFIANLSDGLFTYTGNAYFKPLSKINQSSWVKKRNKSYNGSIRHFISSLYHGVTDKDGFVIKKLGTIDNLNEVLGARDWRNSPVGYAKEEKELVKSLTGSEKIISWNGYIAVIYNKGFEQAEYVNYIGAGGRGISPLSLLQLRDGATLRVDANGNYSSPQDMIVSGYWNWSQRLADMLPMDFEPEGMLQLSKLSEKMQAASANAVVKDKIVLQEVKVSNNPAKLQRLRLEEVERRYTTGSFSLNMANAYSIDVLNDPMAESYLDIYAYITSKIPGLEINNIGNTGGNFRKIKVNGDMRVPSSAPGTGGQSQESSRPVFIELFFLNQSEIDRIILEQISTKDVALIKFYKRFAMRPGMPPALSIYLRKPGDRGYWEMNKK